MRAATATGRINVIEFDVADGRTRFMLMQIPNDENQDPQRLHAPSDYLATLSVRSPRNTQKARAYDLGLWFGWCEQGGHDWLSPTAHLLSSYTISLQTTPRDQPLGRQQGALQLASKTALSDASVRRAIQTLRGFYLWAADNEIISDKTSTRVQAFKAPKATVVAQADRLSAQQMQALLAAVRDHPRDQFIVRLMYGCGLRISQALALTFTDLHLEQDNTILHDCSVRGPHLHVVPRAEQQLPSGVAHKTGRGYWVPVDTKVATAYGEWLSARMIALAEDDESPFVFVSLHGDHAGRPWTMAAAQKCMQRIGRKAQIEEFHAHLLRHTFASELADLGIPTLTLQNLLGHASPNSTAVYMHPLAEEMTSAVDRLTTYREERMR